MAGGFTAILPADAGATTARARRERAEHRKLVSKPQGCACGVGTIDKAMLSVLQTSLVVDPKPDYDADGVLPGPLIDDIDRDALFEEDETWS